MNIYNETIILADQLSITDKLRLIEYLAQSLQRDLAHDPIERPPQPPADPRDEV